MMRYVLIGSLLFILFAGGFAPAGLLSRVVERNTELELIDTRGTVWRGQGQLLLNQLGLGQVDWDFKWLSLFKLTPSYEWALHDVTWRLHGTVGGGLSDMELHAEGTVQASAINEWLQTYDIKLDGSFEITPTDLTLNHNNGSVSQLEGQVKWSGGSVRYTLAGVLREATLPPMTAYLQMTDAGLPQAVVIADNEQTPLLFASEGSPGFVKVGITKLFTKLLQNPWPGGDPDHAVVLEVEEQVF